MKEYIQTDINFEFENRNKSGLRTQYLNSDNDMFKSRCAEENI